ncbi:hypothetical protein COV88_03950 [Candidatus Saccharibacteria bacterium CG11_big_fil_rev_8_21_14_0_20_41_19]|nr:MAG: hypothetical protein AUK57_02460 [Candidatus Saccharibacteria bacterium CG2_30_41_52]PIQ70571.1 MAG: hypothetical protein COV88_03950 [Candidatus Saccharibacteria bacterium CG11_big_fil_rev_8_21_14_0_20_41_19]PIZ59480.1 MAG: hypothetical protein COY18_03170 [Candidatus Saccharibacteria bacterium CG_4_10_14_0_2_um_filter_41_11]PJC29364.1 MAG: hypothetical protein CO052_03780 [Candidatus Saccharibacteria bacterium CG_4_9_14_0_2_um_filter_41_9]PJE66357.1 MAG: hypothetical protein COU92_009
MLKIVISVLSGISLCFLAVLLNVTTPATAGPLGILSIFVFAYLLSLGVVTFFIYWSRRLVSRLSAGLISKKPIEPMTFRTSYYYSTIVAAVPILLIGLQSVGSIGIYEVILVIIFVAIGCLYISKRVS